MRCDFHVTRATDAWVHDHQSDGQIWSSVTIRDRDASVCLYMPDNATAIRLRDAILAAVSALNQTEAVS